MLPWNMRYYNNYNGLHNFSWGNLLFLPIIVPAMIWSLIWKGLALYRAARNGQKWWFCILLIVNTMGILEIVYLLFFSNSKTSKTKK